MELSILRKWNTPHSPVLLSVKMSLIQQFTIKKKKKNTKTNEQILEVFSVQRNTVASWETTIWIEAGRSLHQDSYLLLTLKLDSFDDLISPGILFRAVLCFTNNQRHMDDNDTFSRLAKCRHGKCRQIFSMPSLYTENTDRLNWPPWNIYTITYTPHSNRISIKRQLTIFILKFNTYIPYLVA